MIKKLKHTTLIKAFTISFIIISCGMLKAQLQPDKADSLLNFIKANKNNASVYITKNDTVIARLNPDKLMPLASTVKIMVAIEFAKQAGSNVIDEDSYVSLSEINKYYIPNTDGDAHSKWLKYEQEKNNILNGKIKLIDIARGMIIFSSNANTEYLMDMLGLDNVKSNTQLFGLKYHTPIYPLASSLFMYQNPRNLSESKILKTIKKLSEEEYCRHISQIHMQLKIDSSYKNKFRTQDLTPKMQKLWSDRLPASTTKEYAHMVNILNNRKFLSEKAYGILSHVLEYPMENKGFQKTFKHYGVKGGSTSFVLTHVIYLTTKSNTKMEIAIFFNNLTAEQQQKLQGWLDPFEAQLIFDRQYAENLKL